MFWGYCFLSVAILAEVAGTVSMKFSEGFNRWQPAVAMFVFYAMAIVFLTFALKWLELSLAYAIWAGVGTALVALVGVTILDEALSCSKAFSILLIIAGVVGLHLGSVFH